MTYSLPNSHTTPSRSALTGLRVVLRPSDDGWSLLTPEGRLLHRALGVRGRRDCVEYARASGALAITQD